MMVHTTHDIGTDGACKNCNFRSPEEPCTSVPATRAKTSIEKMREAGLPMSRFPMDHPDHPFHRAQRALDELILCTPTGEVRVKLTVANMHLMEAKHLCSL